MTPTTARALALALPVIRALVVLNLVYAVLLAALLGWSFFIEGWPQRPLGFDLVNAHPMVGNGVRAIVLIGIAGALIVHTILRRLQAIVGTVHGGDPFVLDNADRLQAIAWSVLALEVLRALVATIAAIVWEPGRIDGFSFTPWVAVLLLFVLAGVFRHGARMRDDLDGTV